MVTDNPAVRRLLREALAEDIGSGDITSEAVIPEGLRAEARLIAKETGVLAGVPVALALLEEIGPGIEPEVLVEDGTQVEPGLVVLRAVGPALRLLQVERTLLNFVMRLSGIATMTRRYAERLAGSKTVLLDTRKTTPGLRVLEKYAVRVGGGRNHRMGLYDGVLLKNNHIAVCGDIKEAIRRARERAPMPVKVEVEVRTMEEVRRAVEAGADALLLDHMSREEMARVVDYCNWKVTTEASGNLTPDDVAAAAEIGVDFVSVGALTRSAVWLDFSMSLAPRTEDPDGPA